MNKQLRDVINALLLYRGILVQYKGHKIRLQTVPKGRELLIDEKPTLIITDIYDEFVDQLIKKLEEL